MVVSLLVRGAVWAREKVLSVLRRTVLAVLASGPIPKHVAFVMDGNRRYARSRQLAVQQGHSDGFLALQRVLEICLRLNIRCVTVYAFAIDNFKRTPTEVDALMDLAERKLLDLCDHGALLERYKVRLNVLGDLELLPERVRAAIAVAHEKTRDHDNAILNICMPYSARHDITSAVRATVRETLDEGKDPYSITEGDIAAHLMTSPALSGSPPLDIFIRTSGVKRLSDFLLWQCNKNTQLQFSQVYWPDFGLRHFAPILLDFQRKIWASRSTASYHRRRQDVLDKRIAKGDLPRGVAEDEAEALLRLRASTR